MDEPRGYINKSNGEKQTLYDLTYMWSVKYKTNGQTKNRNRLIDTENKLGVARWEWGRETGKIGERD